MKSNFKIIDDMAEIKINKNLYPKTAITQTTYVLLDKYFFIIDLDENYYIINMKKKEGTIQEEDIYFFLDELIQSQSYLDQLEKTKDIRQTILERALLTQNLNND